MSYNRGYQQGGGAPYRSNMSQNMGQQRSMVSPWQCGVVPNSNSRSQVQNIMPVAQSPVNNNMLAQQHALAVASNLLSTLGMLPQQQHQQHHQELPSLLNMAGLGNNNAPYRQQNQNFGRGAMTNRFGNNLGSVRRKQEQGNYRSEPYNKNRGRQSHGQQSGQHHQQGRGRYPQVSKANTDRKPAAAAVRANDKTPASSKGLADLRLKLHKTEKEQDENGDSTENEKDEAVTKDAESTDKASVEESQLLSETAMDEEAKRDDDDDSKGKKKNKRDWKDEKKTDSGATNEDEPASGKEGEATDEGAEVTAVAAMADGEDNKKKKGGENDNKRELKNADKVFTCHVCDKSAQGELAFVRHMNSKPHKIAMDTLNEQYKIEADDIRRTMQTNIRLEELQMEKLKRMGKTTRTSFNRDYCKMCDLNFYGTLPAHRRNEKHLALKTFLHPRCVPCDKEFPTRLEWDNHNLSILHQLRVDQKTVKAVLDQSHDGIKSVLEDPALKLPEQDVPDQSFTENDEEIQYDPTHCYGLEVTIPGFHCKVCEVFFQKKGEHCKTKIHFTNWSQYKAKERVAADIAKKTIEAEALAEQMLVASEPVITPMEVDVTAVDPATADPPKDDNEGNWKRRRVENEDEEEDDDSEVVVISPLKTTVPLVQLDETPPVKVDEGSAPYDPLEADAESTTDGSKDVYEPDDGILGELDEVIGGILDADKSGKEEVESDDAVPVKGMKARRGARGGPRGRRRK